MKTNSSTGRRKRRRRIHDSGCCAEPMRCRKRRNTPRHGSDIKGRCGCGAFDCSGRHAYIPGSVCVENSWIDVEQYTPFIDAFFEWREMFWRLCWTHPRVLSTRLPRDFNPARWIYSRVENPLGVNSKTGENPLGVNSKTGENPLGVNSKTGENPFWANSKTGKFTAIRPQVHLCSTF